MHPTRKSCGVFVAVALGATIGGFVAYEQRVKPGDTTGLPPLHAAVALELHPKARRSFAPQAIHFLIFHGADPAARDADGKIPADECTIDETALALNRKE